jgi:hypothetical protein
MEMDAVKTGDRAYSRDELRRELAERAQWQPALRRHDLGTGLSTEHENLSF